MEAAGATDVKFTLKQKYSPQLSNLAIPPGFILSMEALKKSGKGINENPVGTGPFKFVEWKKDDHTTVDDILALKPRRVLEIGCGTGLLLFRVAPHCESYVGVDFSAPAAFSASFDTVAW